MRTTVIVPVIMLVFFATGCGSKDEAIPAVPQSVKAGTITATPCVFKQFKTQEFAARCGVLYVPENRAKLGSRLIALPYVRIPARTKTPGAPVFALGGGPGQSNLNPGFPVAWFDGKRDVVLIGFRGVDGTVRLDCPEISAKLGDGGPLLDASGIARLRQSSATCARHLTGEGIDLSAYTVLDVVDDLEAARIAFGYGRIDFVAISYGTRLALIYGWRYPEHVERNALVDVNPPGRFWLDPALLDRQIRRYGELCAKDVYCASRTKDLAADIRTALANMPRRWLAFPVHRDAVLLATFMGLYTTNGAATVFDMWIAAAHGDYSGMALATAALPFMLPPMAWGDVAAKGTSADFGSGKACEGLEPGKTLIGSPLNVMACAVDGVWPAHKIPAAFRAVPSSSVPTLLVGGTLDVATPFENARDALLPVMPAARQVVVAEAGHSADLIYQQKDATERLLTSFFDSGRADASQFRYRPVNFDPGWMRFPLIAKTLLAAAAVLAALLGLLTRWIVRRRRRR